ncbi:MAG: type VI secretion system protein TssA [Aquabacterium sp.]|uniref:type VI secretion system protein TssA n=1 Tax=Aquabacterium sp. TaxID=1872578 RepID=UPI003BAF4616
MSEHAAQVDLWLEPLGNSPCGEDLEYDNDFLELSKAAEGKPETQFAAAEPPDWRSVRSLSSALLERTRDLRIGLYWGRAQLHLDGFTVLPELLRLMREWLERQWDDVHPRLDPDDGDPYARINALSQFEDGTGALADVRQSLLIRSRNIGQLSVRDVALALDLLPAREDETPMGTGTITQMLADAIEETPGLATAATRALDELSRIADLFNDRVGYGRAPLWDDLRDLLRGIERVMPEPAVPGSAGDDIDLDALLSDLGADAPGDAPDGGIGTDVAPAPGPARKARGGVGDSIESRADAIKAIDLICQYLERNEPTNPAQLLLKRARRMIDKNFMDIIRELAPDAIHEVAKIMGVDPNEFHND